MYESNIYKHLQVQRNKNSKFTIMKPIVLSSRMDHWHQNRIASVDVDLYVFCLIWFYTMEFHFILLLSSNSGVSRQREECDSPFHSWWLLLWDLLYHSSHHCSDQTLQNHNSCFVMETERKCTISLLDNIIFFII